MKRNKTSGNSNCKYIDKFHFIIIIIVGGIITILLNITTIIQNFYELTKRSGHEQRIPVLEQALPDSCRAHFYDLIYNFKADMDIDEQIRVINFIINMSQGDELNIAKKFKEAIESYDRASRFMQEEIMPKYKKIVAQQDDFIFLNPINNTTESVFLIFLDLSQSQFEEILKSIKNIKKNTKIIDTNKLVNAEYVESLCYYQLGRIFMFKDLFVEANHDSLRQIAYRSFNAAKDNLPDAEKALNYLIKDLNFQP